MTIAPARDPNRAYAAIGAMFFFVFGGIWLAYYALQTSGMQPTVLAAIALAAVTLLFLAWHRYLQHRSTRLEDAPSSHRKEARRVFHIVNTAQWLAILVSVNVLTNLGRTPWIKPTLILIVGVHFLPLARAFGRPTRMEERLAALGGSVAISSVQKGSARGTRLTLRMPMPQEAKASGTATPTLQQFVPGATSA